MKKPLYREALGHGWRLAWKHSWLWPLGLFAALLGQMGMVDLLIKASSGVSNYPTLPVWTSIPSYISIGFAQFRETLPAEGWPSLILLIIILLLIMVVFAFVAVVSQGAIVDIAARTTKRKKLPDVGDAWHKGVEHFWSLFFMNLLKKLFVAVIAITVFFAAANVAVGTTAGGLLLFFLLFFIALFVGLVLSFLLVYAIGYVVVEKYRFGEALASAWKLFLEHPLVSLEVGFIILFINILVGVVTVFGVIVLFIPAIMFWFVYLLSGLALPFVVGFFVGLLLSILFIMFLGSIFAIFTTSVWTYLFMKMHKTGIKSRILHIFR